MPSSATALSLVEASTDGSVIDEQILNERLAKHRLDLEKVVASNTKWHDLSLHTWHLVSFILLVTCLTGAGLMGGFYLHQASDAATKSLADSQLQQILTALVPGVILVLTIFIGFVGLKRLELYDTELREARKEQREQQRSFEKEVNDSIEKQTGSRVVSLLHQALTAHKGEISDLENKISNHKQEMERKIVEHEAAIEGVLQDYSWIKNASEDQRKAFRDENMVVLSAGQAHKTITKLFTKGDVRTALTIIDRLIVDEKASGTANDWFNISAELGRNDQERYALRACQRGLSHHPTNIDLISHALQFASNLGDWDEAEKHYQSLLRIDKQDWNWRAFTFAFDYLVLLNRTIEAIEICKPFAKFIPTEERAYSQVAKLYMTLGQTAKAVEVCKEGMAAIARTPQICSVLAEALTTLGQYDDALEACDDALSSAAELQPGIWTPGVIWRRATIFDTKVINALRDSEDNLADALAFARQAIVNYRAALEMDEDYRRQGQLRMAVLLARLMEAGVSKSSLLEIFGAEEENAAAQAFTEHLARNMQA